MRRLPRAIKLTTTVAVFLAGGLVAAAGTGEVSGQSTTDSNLRVSRWAPSKVEFIAQNNNAGFSSGVPNATVRFAPYTATFSTRYNLGSNYWTSNSVQGTLEIGMKNTGINACNDELNSLRIGYPSTVRVAVDFTEDGEDAVIWVTDLPTLRADVTYWKAYSFSWRCSGSVTDGGRYDDDPGALEVQLGAWNGVATPGPTYSRATTHFVPPENKHLLVPPENSTGQSLIQSTLFGPWVDNAGFESGVSGWQTSTAEAYHYGGGQNAPSEGTSYALLQPPTGGPLVRPSNAWIRSMIFRDFRVVQFNNAGETFSLGSRTDYAFDGTFRCMPWSPDWSRKPGSTCRVTISLKTHATEDWTGTAYYWDIPANGEWYFIASDAWGAQTSDDDIRIWVDSNGYFLDVDHLWVTSGY